ncbi:hypothetical protein Patl1_33839 [Pistacia atlantica]|uniref:Uncharacterized protein n=1 Tax=Pistacia atlantica TaxID=434234 RepID=A0ACC0ZUB8_9ROSI|nr:hypothetical protein Patl1_33839 [Pistacia atlantica]
MSAIRDQEISSMPLLKGCILMVSRCYVLAGTFCFLPSIEEYNDIMAVDALLQKVLDDKYLQLSANGRDVLHWGKNIISAKTWTKKELVGYLYLTNAKRLEEVMGKLGFSTGSST